jgi:hypothetical protein
MAAAGTVAGQIRRIDMRVLLLVGKTIDGEHVVIESGSGATGDQRILRKDVIDSGGILPDGTCLSEVYLMAPVKKTKFHHKRIGATVKSEPEPDPVVEPEPKPAPFTKPRARAKATRKRT